MPRKSKLTKTLIDRIVELKRLQFNNSQIANAIGVSRQTLWNWQQQGKTQKRGLARQYVDAIEKVEYEMYQRYVTAVQNEALTGKRVVTKKHLRDANGKVTATEKTERQESPNASLALKLLQTHYPE